MTLIEMMVVVIIIALFAVLVGPNLFKQADKAKVTAARVQIESFEAALVQFHADNGVFPAQEQGLDALRPYMKKDIPLDPVSYTHLWRSGWCGYSAQTAKLRRAPLFRPKASAWTPGAAQVASNAADPDTPAVWASSR